MKRLLVLILSSALLCGCSAKNSFTKISVEETAKLLKSTDAVLVDVREEDEFKASHIKGAINISVNNINDILEVVKDKDRRIILYCRTGIRSKKAAMNIVNLGYTRVYDMGGINKWTYELEGDDVDGISTNS